VRAEIECVAGPRQWGDTRESCFLESLGRSRNCSPRRPRRSSLRAVKSLWYGEIKDREHHAARDIRRAAELVNARKEALALTLQYSDIVRGMSGTDKNFFREDIARLERVARLLGGLDRRA